MTRDDVLAFCSGMTGVVEEYPFGDEVAVFKVAGKMFALVMLEGEPGFVNLKCDPDLALELRARHAAVELGYHANKRHWNSVHLASSIEDVELREMIDHSHTLIVNRLPRAERAPIQIVDRRLIRVAGSPSHGIPLTVRSRPCGVPLGYRARNSFT